MSHALTQDRGAKPANCWDSDVDAACPCDSGWESDWDGWESVSMTVAIAVAQVGGVDVCLVSSTEILGALFHTII